MLMCPLTSHLEMGKGKSWLEGAEVKAPDGRLGAMAVPMPGWATRCFDQGSWASSTGLSLGNGVALGKSLAF